MHARLESYVYSLCWIENMLIKIWYRYRYELAKKLACMGGGAMVM